MPIVDFGHDELACHLCSTVHLFWLQQFLIMCIVDYLINQAESDNLGKFKHLIACIYTA